MLRVIRGARDAKALALTLVFWACAATSASPQSVRGRVIDEAGEVPMAGAIVSLLDPGGARVRAVLTNQSGVFVLRATPGSYRLRVEMIGRQSVEAGLFQVVEGQEPAAQTIRMPVQPIILSGIDVRGAGRCDGSQRAARETYLVWEEAEKALRATSITNEQPLYRFHVSRFVREFYPRSGQVLRDSRNEEVSVRSDQFTSLAPAEIERIGYVKTEGRETLIYGPNTDVLLSREFQTTHCLGLRRDRSRPEWIGLTFEPVDGRDVPEIEGVLWLDAASAELRSLEFEYRNMPGTLIRGDYTGSADFIRLPEGTWIIRRWQLGGPAREEGAEVLRIERATPAPGS
jgi:hypothetical protein